MEELETNIETSRAAIIIYDKEEAWKVIKHSIRKMGKSYE